MSRYFLFSAVLSLAVGSLLGLYLALGFGGLVSINNFPRLLECHSVLQVHGFMVMLILGVALMVLPKFLEVPLALPKLALLTWALLNASVLITLLARPSLPTRYLELTAIVAFLAVLRRTRASASYQEPDPHERRINRLHAGFMACGAVWLLLSVTAPFGRSSQELILWGFASMYVAGIGLRVHPEILGYRVGSVSPMAWSLLLWNLGLALEFGGWAVGRTVTCVGISLYLLGLHPFRRPSFAPVSTVELRAFLRIAYAWLATAVTATLLAPRLDYLALNPAILHLLTSGFLLTMVMGMAFELTSTHGGLLMPPTKLVRSILMFLTLGGLLRFLGHAGAYTCLFTLGATCQVLASLLFSLTLGFSLLRSRHTRAVTYS